MKQPTRRRIGVGTGVLVGLAITAWLHAPGQAQLRAPGPMNSGHGTVACESCHREAPGTTRQQLQTVVRHWIGRDDKPVDLGFRAVGNAECESCHVRPDDRHPVYRFLEPRFADARAAIHPEQCTSCHREHAGVRVTVADGTYCRQCHGDLSVENDPIDVPHRELVKTQRWDSCLGCHDFHGNHGMKSPTRIDDAIPPAAILTYLRGGASPYPPPIVRARTPEVKTP
ncbi:MAG: hypothetical protein HOV81_26480 [Kofleriaceae bacterium]|nr:hypothetical protein [Kofleriaceae bacterium]